MMRYRFPLLAGVLVAAGFIGSWMAPTRPEAFAQQTQTAQQTATDASEEDRGWIGVMIETGPNGELLIQDVFPGGPAAFAGLRKGDVLVKAGAQEVRSEEEVAAAAEQLTPGDEAVVVIRRNGVEQPMHIRVGSLHDFHARYAQEMYRRDPRHPQYAKSHGISQTDLSVEVVRRLFEQNQRLETALHDLRDEVHALRSELKARDNAGR